MILLAFDTETTGLPLFDQPSDDPRQPHLVQLAAALVDQESRKTIASLDVVVRPEGWTIPDEVAEIHGITTEHAAQVGVSEAVALSLFDELWKVADFRLAHNESFDRRLLRIAYKRYRNDEEADIWKAGKAECTARLASPIMKMAPTEKMRAAGRNHSKTPKLTEAYEHFTGKKLENAHSAMADVLGCLAVYWAIQDLNPEPEKIHPLGEGVDAAPAAADGDVPFLN